MSNHFRFLSMLPIVAAAAIAFMPSPAPAQLAPIGSFPGFSSHPATPPPNKHSVAIGNNGKGGGSSSSWNQTSSNKYTGGSNASVRGGYNSNYRGGYGTYGNRSGYNSRGGYGSSNRGGYNTYGNRAGYSYGNNGYGRGNTPYGRGSSNGHVNNQRDGFPNTNQIKL